MRAVTKLDASLHSIVVTCSACPSWRELRGSRGSAHAAAADHLERAHDGWQAAAKARELAARNTPLRGV